MGTCAISAVVTAVGACSNSQGTTDAGADGGEGGVAACGNPPYANVHARVTSLTTGAPVEGATITLDPSPCTKLEVTTDGDGGASLRIALNTAVNPRIQRSGYLTERAPEQSYKGDFSGGGWLVPTVAAGALPHFNATSPDVLALIYGPSDASADASCTSTSGATFSVVGHPEAVITYYQPGVDGGLPTPDTQLQATTSLGGAEISGLTAGQTVELRVSSPTCPTVSFVSAPMTGRIYLENGVLTAAPAFLVP